MSERDQVAPTAVLFPIMLRRLSYIAHRRPHGWQLVLHKNSNASSKNKAHRDEGSITFVSAQIESHSRKLNPKERDTTSPKHKFQLSQTPMTDFFMLEDSIFSASLSHVLLLMVLEQLSRMYVKNKRTNTALHDTWPRTTNPLDNIVAARFSIEKALCLCVMQLCQGSLPDFNRFAISSFPFESFPYDIGQQRCQAVRWQVGFRTSRGSSRLNGKCKDGQCPSHERLHEWLQPYSKCLVDTNSLGDIIRTAVQCSMWIFASLAQANSVLPGGSVTLQVRFALTSTLQQLDIIVSLPPRSLISLKTPVVTGSLWLSNLLSLRCARFYPDLSFF
ncbi:hypothetical protein Hypma_011081 [Hypsizygus marmoreus]|uniref:Uncharacterized protein n=1 Tax=Hypsizygus marmoreus TaxID=39966 RepID=A0A369JJB2_HYPMA|nr:hypothetical protein Hypma_011081 [Hypsizygus marmoreus]